MANNPAMGLNVALGVYLGQIIVLFILLFALRDATFFDPKVFAGTIVACALVWTTLIVREPVQASADVRGTRVDPRACPTILRSFPAARSRAREPRGCCLRRRGGAGRLSANMNPSQAAVDRETPNVAWTVMNNLIAGILIYGGLGFLIGTVAGERTPSVWPSGPCSGSWRARTLSSSACGSWMAVLPHSGRRSAGRSRSDVRGGAGVPPRFRVWIPRPGRVDLRHRAVLRQLHQAGVPAAARLADHHRLLPGRLPPAAVDPRQVAEHRRDGLPVHPRRHQPRGHRQGRRPVRAAAVHDLLLRVDRQPVGHHPRRAVPGELALRLPGGPGDHGVGHLHVPRACATRAR